jgi:hypothetical protein
VGFVANVIATMPSQDMSAFAPLASPALTGTPTAPTPAEGDNSTKIATTAFVATRSPVLSVNGETGVVVLSVGDVSGAAPLNNPTFTGAVTLSTVPLAGADDSTVPSCNHGLGSGKNCISQCTKMGRSSQVCKHFGAQQW